MPLKETQSKSDDETNLPIKAMKPLTIEEHACEIMRSKGYTCNSLDTIRVCLHKSQIIEILLQAAELYCQSHKAAAWEEGFKAAVFHLDDEIEPVNPYTTKEEETKK